MSNNTLWPIIDTVPYYIRYSRISKEYKLYVVLEVRFKVKGMNVNDCDGCGGSGQLVDEALTGH